MAGVAGPPQALGTGRGASVLGGGRERWVCQVKRRVVVGAAGRATQQLRTETPPTPSRQGARAPLLGSPAGCGRSNCPFPHQTYRQRSGFKTRSRGFLEARGRTLHCPQDTRRTPDPGTKTLSARGGAKRKETPVRKALCDFFPLFCVLKCFMTICWKI